MATLLSVNVGLPRDVAWNGRTVHTGIWKQPVSGPVMARRLNLDGDGQGDLNGHGGEQRAVMVYQAQSYEHWRSHLGRTDLTWGIFGENFTVDGLPDDQVCIGDRYRIGDAEFEVTQPRVTCYRVGLRLEEPRMPALLVAHHRPGFYLRVLREGRVQAGDPIVKIGAAAEQISVATTDAQLAYLKSDPNNVATNKNADASGYTALQKKAVEIISGAKHISQFMDRDTRPDFASTVMIQAIQEFIKNPKDIDSLCKNIETQKKNIFAS